MSRFGTQTAAVRPGRKTTSAFVGRPILSGIGIGILMGLVSGSAAAGERAQETPSPLAGVKIEQRLGVQVPGDLRFRDDAGREVRLSDYFGKQPTVLVLVYFRCPMLCGQVLGGVVQSLQNVSSLKIGRDYQVVTVSFDPKDTPEGAAKQKAIYTGRLGDPDAAAAWHFLTGDDDSIRRLCEAVGFFFKLDPVSGHYAHASGITLLTPGGKTSRYFYGIRYKPRDMRLGLVEASEGRVGTPVDAILLYCFHYDGSTGKYTASVMRMVRLGGAVTLLVLGAFIFGVWRSSRRVPRPEASNP